MSNNTMRPVLRAGRSARLETPIRTSQLQTRCFSVTAPTQLGNVISFRGKTSNETLDTTLRELSKKVILPAYLPIPLQKRIFRTRWKAKLDIEPIEIEVDGKPVKLKHIDKVPASKKNFFKAMDHMKTKQDWEKFPKLLEALWYHAKRTFVPGDWPRMIRKAGAGGNLGPIFDVCRKPTRTGMLLTRSETVQELMSAICWQTAGAGWTADATAQAVRDTSKVIDFLQEVDHQLTGLAKKQFEETGMHPLKRDPQLMAHPVVFAAAMIALHGKREKFMPVLKKYGDLMLERWPENKGLLEVHPHTAYVNPEGVQYLMERGKFIVVASPILRGFDLAVEALGDDPMGEAIRSRRDAVAAEVQSALADKSQRKNSSGKMVQKNRRGQEMHARVFMAPQLQASVKAKAKAGETIEA